MLSVLEDTIVFQGHMPGKCYKEGTKLRQGLVGVLQSTSNKLKELKNNKKGGSPINNVKGIF